MATISTKLDDAGRKLVSDSVARAEAGTAGEIVTIITEQSDDYGDIALAWSVAVAMLALAVLSVFPDFYLGLIDRLTGSWENAWTPREVLVLAGSVAALKFIGMTLLQLWKPLRFALVPRSVKAARTRARAVTFFKVGAERRGCQACHEALGRQLSSPFEHEQQHDGYRILQHGLLRDF